MANGNFNDLPIPYTTDIPGSAVTWTKGILSGAAAVDSMYKASDAGAYYLNNVTTTPTNYGTLIVFSAYEGDIAAYQVIVNGGANLYFRQKYGTTSNPNWSSWRRAYSAPTDFEYKMPIVHSLTIPYGGTKTIKFSSTGARGELIFSSAYTDIRGMFIFYAEAGGNVRTTGAPAPTGISLSTSTAGLAITNNSGNGVSSYVEILLTSGTIASIT